MNTVNSNTNPEKTTPNMDAGASIQAFSDTYRTQAAQAMEAAQTNGTAGETYPHQFGAHAYYFDMQGARRDENGNPIPRDRKSEPVIMKMYENEDWWADNGEGVDDVLVLYSSNHDLSYVDDYRTQYFEDKNGNAQWFGAQKTYWPFDAQEVNMDAIRNQRRETGERVPVAQFEAGFYNAPNTDEFVTIYDNGTFDLSIVEKMPISSANERLKDGNQYIEHQIFLPEDALSNPDAEAILVTILKNMPPFPVPQKFHREDAQQPFQS